MLPPRRIEELKNLFYADGIELTDEAALEVGLWLLERARAVAVKIPPHKASIFDKIQREMASFRNLYKVEERRDDFPK